MLCRSSNHINSGSHQALNLINAWRLAIVPYKPHSEETDNKAISRPFKDFTTLFQEQWGSPPGLWQQRTVLPGQQPKHGWFAAGFPGDPRACTSPAGMAVLSLLRWTASYRPAYLKGLIAYVICLWPLSNRLLKASLDSASKATLFREIWHMDPSSVKQS